MKTTRILGSVVALAVSVLAMSCGSDANTGSTSAVGGGTQKGSGGATATTQASGGNTTSTVVSTGGSSAPAGGSTSTGGVTATGGTVAKVGTTGTGGLLNRGGSVSKGGTTGAGGSVSTGGSSSNAGGTAGGTSSKGGTTATGGSSTAGGKTGTGGTTATTTGTGTRADGPCDIYKAASTPCAAAYSMIRGLSKTYSGALYQVRAGSSTTNTGSGGSGGSGVKDIPMTLDGYADTTVQDAFCAGTVCTVSLLYDQSGNGNNLPVAKKGLSAGGSYAASDDFESSATKGSLTVAGHKVYSLYMNSREGYRLAAVGKGMPLKTAAQGIYELADGSRVGSQCCWDFGNVTTNPTAYHTMNTLFFGIAFWGKGAGNGPWFMADFEAGVWAGGSKNGDPGWGALDQDSPANTNNPSMKVPFAFGVLKTTATTYVIRAADLQKATDLTTAFDGALPKSMDNQGGIVLGVGGDNSNNSAGTFYEGAVTAGAPASATDLSVLKNVQAAGYPK